MRGGLFSAGLGRAGKGINPQGGAKVKSAGRAGVKKRVNRLIPKILQKCVKEKYNITYYDIKGRGPEKKPGKSVVFCPKN